MYNTGDGSKPHSVATADFNNDTRLDIIVANYGTNNIGILLGYSNGSFGTMNTYSTGTNSGPYSVAVDDFNNDRHLDIVVSNSEADNIAIFLGYGNGSFNNGTKYSTGIGSRPYIVTLGDMNNDNVLDIIIANSGTSNIVLFHGDGTGAFGKRISYALGYGYHPYSVAVNDLNRDGWLDIVIACFDTNHIEILLKIC